MRHAKDSMMTRPAKLTPPLLSAYPYIDFMLFDSREYGANIDIPYGTGDENWTFDDEEYAKAHFSKASAVKPEHMAPLAAMTESTFERLIGQFGYYINGVSVKTKNDLALASVSEDPDIDEDDWQPCIKGASLEQVQSYLLYRNNGYISVDWGNVVAVYNDSEPDQQEATYQFFKLCINRSLEELLEMVGPEPLPASIVPVLETKVIDGRPCSYDEFKDDFVKDAHMIRNFDVAGFEYPQGGAQYAIACAMTLEEAFAYATRFTLEGKPMHRVSIQYAGNCIASAEVNGKYNSIIGKFQPVLPIKLSWNIDRSVPEISKERLEKALFAAEKAMGVSWSKVGKLEDELGL
jgi:hypothetical protein